MSNPAVPRYVIQAAGSFAGTPPGHRFNLYFPLWNEQWSPDKDSAKVEALRQVLPLGDGKAVLDQLRSRQRALAGAYPDACRLVVEARSTAPFATGLGLEHPVENGFAFLSPYGLPYLAGSGVKGVLRRAAEELEQSGETGPDKTSINELFGAEDPAVLGTGAPSPDKDRRRGALTCWDVVPSPAQDALVIEIMTPHYAHYYQDGKSPHDAGKPNPIAFLAVPAGSEFTFVVTCEPAFLSQELRGKWRGALERIFRHAFDWLGFGAKTAVGYGALRAATAEELAHTAAQSLQCAWVDEWIGDFITKNRAKKDDALRSRGLADAWSALTEMDVKKRALADIIARWKEKGWWENPQGKARQVKAIYESEVQ